MLIALLQGIIDAFSGILSVLVAVLPTSPFKALSQLTVDNEMLAALAWLVPFPQIIALLEAWASAIGIYYCWMVVARWAKLLS